MSATRAPLCRVITAADHSIDKAKGCIKMRFRDGEMRERDQEEKKLKGGRRRIGGNQGEYVV